MGPQRRILPRGLALAILAAILLQVPAVGGAPSPQPVSGAAEWRRLQEALAGLEVQEKAILAELFRLQRAAEEAEARLGDLETRRQSAEAALAAARDELDRARALHARRRDEAARLLRLVQRLGPASYLGVLLGAESWTDFTARLGAVTVTVRSVRQGLGRLREAQDELRRREGELAAREAQLAAAVEAERAGLARLVDARAEREAALAALGSERERYLDRLAALERGWLDFVQPLVQRMGTAFRRLAGEVREIPGARVALGGGGVRLRVPEAGLNQLLAADPDLRGFRFRLEDGGARLEAPELALTLRGRFAIDGGAVLVYEVEGAELAGVALDSGAVREALGGRGLAVDLSPVLGPWRLHAVRVDGGELEFTVGIGLGRDPRPPAVAGGMAA